MNASELKSHCVLVNIEKLVYGGEGLARVDGQVLLVPYVLPRERVEIAPDRRKGGVLRGSVASVVEPAPQRTVPRCEYFTNCGGCHYQHAEYGLELEQKRSILRETFERVGGIRYDAEIALIRADPWYYRNRIQLHFRARNSGFHKAASGDVCPITHCEISSPMLNEAIRKFQSAAKEPQWPQSLNSIEVFTNEKQIQLNIIDSTRPVAARFFDWCAGFLPALSRGPIDYEVAAHSFHISPGSFFQVNRFLIDSLVQEVVADATGSHVIDLYAGVGLFSLPLANRFERVDAIERSGPASRDLAWNVEHSGALNIRATRTSAEDFLRDLAEAPDLIVADPPRAGLGSEATAALLGIKPPKLKLVSCDPATLARDLRKLLASYAIERITLVDLFPRTYHFETVVHLLRNRL